MQILIDVGADVSAQGVFYGHTLQTGTFTRVEYRNALHAATEEGHENVVQMLKDAGAVDRSNCMSVVM
jgi:hypothetical protein